MKVGPLFNTSIVSSWSFTPLVSWRRRCRSDRVCRGGWRVVFHSRRESCERKPPCCFLGPGRSPWS